YKRCARHLVWPRPCHRGCQADSGPDSGHGERRALLATQARGPHGGLPVNSFSVGTRVISANNIAKKGTVVDKPDGYAYDTWSVWVAWDDWAERGDSAHPAQETARALLPQG